MNTHSWYSEDGRKDQAKNTENIYKPVLYTSTGSIAGYTAFDNRLIGLQIHPELSPAVGKDGTINVGAQNTLDSLEMYRNGLEKSFGQNVMAIIEHNFRASEHRKITGNPGDYILVYNLLNLARSLNNSL